MGSVNVNRSVSDQFYRYKMPRLIAKVEGKGNGIKTVIANMVEIGKSLNRPPTYPTKYFGCELGAQTQFDFKNDRFIVNGSHDAYKLQSLLDGFIKKFVLCPECDNPETKLLVNQKKQSINQHCIACGYQGMVDMRHKLTTFIVKNPPGQAPTAVGASMTTSKEKGKSKRKGEKGKKNGDADGSRGDDCSDGDFGSADKDGSDDFDDDWGEDTSEDAVAKRMEDLSNGAKGMTLNDDMEKTQQERLDIFYEFVKKRKADGTVDGLDKEIVAEAERLDIRDKALLVLSELLFNEQMLQQIKQHRILFLRFTHCNAKAQKYLLGGFEQLVKMYHDALIAKVPHLLKAFYDLDILEEQVIIEWAKKVSKKYVSKELSQEVRERAAPFIKWLEEAEEEDSEDDDEEEDKVEIVYSDRNLPPVRPAVAEQPKVITACNDEDLDIDAI